MRNQKDGIPLHYKLFITSLWMFLLCPALIANNLQVKNLQLVDSQHVAFTVQWSNSWNLVNEKPPFNHDAVWFFLKYRQKNTKKWQHAYISRQSADHQVIQTVENKVMLDGVEDEAGLWIKRQKLGSGKVPQTTIQIRLAKPLPKGRYQFKAFGIEMVKVKKDSFYLGDGASNHTLQVANSGRPYHVTDPGQIPVDDTGKKLTSAGKLPPAGDIPKDYPVGYEAFYAMKYEISQAQYVAFLNTLKPQQQAQRIANDPSAEEGTSAFGKGRGNRNGIMIQEPASNGNPAVFVCDANRESPQGANDDGQNRACNFLTWADVAAYLDWAGLAPMTETAFEKLCRGPLKPVEKEFAWGKKFVTDANNIVNDGTPTETVDEELPPNSGLASHGYRGPKGPLRNGFAGADTSNRLSIGAGYYGALELSGNLWELVVTLNEQGLNFKGRNGDGKLTEQGYANQGQWPGNNGEGAGFKGGGWNSGILEEFRDLAVSDRFYIYDNPTDRRGTVGGRGVRYTFQ